MTEESRENVSGQTGASSTSPGEMAEALEAVKAAAPELADKIAAAGITPRDLAEARERANSDEESR